MSARKLLLTSVATAALLLTAPGVVGIASAHDGGGSGGSQGSQQSEDRDDHDGQGSASQGNQNTGSPNSQRPTPASSISPDLQNAIKSAREAYKTTARTIKDQLRTTLAGFRTSVQNDTATQLADVKAKRLAYLDALAKNADQSTLDSLKAALKASVDAYRTAWIAAKTKYQTQIDAAIAKAQTDIANAGTVYTQAVKDAFAKYAPGTTIPSGLLDPPGQNIGEGHLGWKSRHH